MSYGRARLDAAPQKSAPGHRLSRIHCHASFDETFDSLQRRERLDGSHKDQLTGLSQNSSPLNSFRTMAVATTMISYGGFLGACGWYGAHTSGAMHSLYAGRRQRRSHGALRQFGEPKKGDKAGLRAENELVASTPSTRPSESLLSRGRRSTQDYKKWMIAVHLGSMFNALFGVVFCVQYLRSRGDPDKPRGPSSSWS